MKRTAWRPTLPLLDRATLAMRQALAIHVALDTARTFYVGGHAFRLVPSRPLARYSLRMCLVGARGRLVIAVECANWMPELSSEVLATAIGDPAGLADWVDWAAMPWLDALEQALGCGYRVERAELDAAAPPGALTMAAVRRDGHVAHVAVNGEPLSDLARSMQGGFRAPIGPWMRLPLAVLFRVRGIPLSGLERLATGAVLRLYQHDLLIRFGRRPRIYDMQAQWIDDQGVARSGTGEGACDHVFEDPDAQALASLDELTFDIDVVLETRTLSMDEARGVCKGAVIELKRPLDGRQVALVSNGKTFARGSLVSLGSSLAVVIEECRGPRA